MAMMREPGFMGLAKQKAKREGMLEVPKRYQPDGGGAEEYPAFVNEQEMAMLKKQGGSGFMTPYGVPSFRPDDGSRGDDDKGGPDSQDRSGRVDSAADSARGMRNDRREARYQAMSDAQYGPPREGGTGPDGRIDYSGGGGQTGGGMDTGHWGDGRGGGGYTPPPPKTPEQIEAERKAKAKEKYDAGNKEREAGQQGKTWDRQREQAVRGTMKDAEGRTQDQQGVMTDASGKVEGDEGFDFESATLQGGYDASTGKLDTTDSFEDYKQQAKGLGAEAKGITDSFGKDAENLAGYQSKFDQMAGEAKTRGDEAEKFQQGQGTKYQDTAGKGAQALEGIAGEVKTAAQSGADAYGKGADAVSGVQDQFGKEGFQAESGALQDKVGGYESKIAGMADKVASGEAGQSQAAMLKGQMEEGRMASQKGSEEKLRREMAQSGASPAEIASKVAQFQKQSSADQAQAGRSEALSSQLQGQQMGQAQMGAAAGLTGQAMGAVGQQSGMLGQRAGMAGQQASLGAQQAALRGQGAAMQMQGAGQRAGIQGQAAGMNMQGIQGNAAMNAQGNQMGMAGANQQASMMGQGMGAVQAAGAAKGQQMGGLGQQGQFIDQQGGYTQAQLNDVMAQQTQQYSADQSEATRQANAAANSGGGGGNKGFFGNLFSDIRLKDSIELLQEGMDGEPNIYSFKYKWDSNTTWSGVMAQELLNTKHADAVILSPEGYYKVDYGKLGIPMTQLSVKEQHGI